MSTIKTTGYTVYPTGYDDTETPSDKYHFVIKVEDRGKGWAVVDGPFVLTKDGDWEYEPNPSSRDDEFYERCRFSERRAKILAPPARATGDRHSIPQHRLEPKKSIPALVCDAVARGHGAN